MFKRMITMIMVLAMIIGTFAISASAACRSEEGRPDIIGKEHIDAVIALYETYEIEEREPDYNIEMVEVEEYWLVYLEGNAGEYYGYSALGFYEHMPDEEEIDILWTNRMTDDEFDILCEKYGI